MSEPNPMFPAAHNAGVRRPAILAVPAERGLQWLGIGWRLFLKAPWMWLGISVVLMGAFVLIGIVGLILLVLALLPLLLGSIYAGYCDIHGQVVTAPSSPATAG